MIDLTTNRLLDAARVVQATSGARIVEFTAVIEAESREGGIDLAINTAEALGASDDSPVALIGEDGPLLRIESRSASIDIVWPR